MKISIKGIKGKDFVIDPNDKLSIKIAMLIEGQCTIGVQQATKKYGYTEQRYYQLLAKYRQGGAHALIDQKRGSDTKPVRKKDVLNQIIRLRFLDPVSNSGVIAQKLKQMDYKVSQRSVERTITEYGLQKKRPIS
jgi:transposase